ncbi:hypothetical protein [Nitratireductor basaltis]|uniref:Flagellar basal body-associated protein FliL n=1 Tax=Nitratireductor basaltis TaxID=472175 RepID=A0A084U878_9HYPH|nr:hypothetical protein [Nitratireductor basaltis]KFB09164.1 hypothetical protein EL18_00179 [Nitratireductor basaltis]
MIKFIFAALWICAASLGAVFYGFKTAQAEKVAEPPPAFFGGLDYVNTGVISVPVVSDGQVSGYFLARLVYTVEPEKLKKLSVPPEVLFVDQLHAHLYSNPQIDYSRHKELDLDAMRDGIRDSINERVGDKLVHDVLVEQIDYLGKDEIRDNAMRRRIGPDE